MPLPQKIIPAKKPPKLSSVPIPPTRIREARIRQKLSETMRTKDQQEKEEKQEEEEDAEEEEGADKDEEEDAEEDEQGEEEEEEDKARKEDDMDEEEEEQDEPLEDKLCHPPPDFEAYFKETYENKALGGRFEKLRGDWCPVKAVVGTEWWLRIFTGHGEFNLSSICHSFAAPDLHEHEKKLRPLLHVAPFKYIFPLWSIKESDDRDEVHGVVVTAGLRCLFAAFSAHAHLAMFDAARKERLTMVEAFIPHILYALDAHNKIASNEFRPPAIVWLLTTKLWLNSRSSYWSQSSICNFMSIIERLLRDLEAWTTNSAGKDKEEEDAANLHLSRLKIKEPADVAEKLNGVRLHAYLRAYQVVGVGWHAFDLAVERLFEKHPDVVRSAILEVVKLHCLPRHAALKQHAVNEKNNDDKNNVLLFFFSLLPSLLLVLFLSFFPLFLMFRSNWSHFNFLHCSHVTILSTVWPVGIVVSMA